MSTGKLESCPEQRTLADPGIEKRIDDLLGAMTLEDKIGQLNQLNGGGDEVKAQVRAGRVGSLLNIRGADEVNSLQKIAVTETRLKIPLIIGNDVIHGYKTIFPIPLGETATWNPELLEKAAAVAATEARAAGTHWTFAPMVDIARDPRWGRIAEGSGEDPFLGAVAATARIRGFQGPDMSAPDRVAACAKHYIGYGAAEAGRDYNTVDISPNSLWNIFLPPFHASVAAGVATMMSAFNDLNGVPASGNRFTLTDILRDRFKFNGFVVSDWNSIAELINHGFAATPAEAARLGFNAGVDMDMIGTLYLNHLKDLLAKGSVTQEAIDTAVRRIFRVKFKTGLFDNPYSDPAREKSVTLCTSHLALAREIAAKSLVLLKNEGNILPLSRDIDSIAIIGPLADDRAEPLGTWSCEGKPEDTVTVLEGIKQTVSPRTTINYEKGCEIEHDSPDESAGFAKSIKAAKASKVAVLVLGEAHLMSGEGGCRTEIGLPGRQQELVRSVLEARVPIIVVLMSGRPLAIPWLDENVTAIIEAWHPGTQCGNAIADVLFGNQAPAGRLPVSFPRRLGQIPIYYAHKSTGRPADPNNRTSSKYLDVPNTPLYPFGYGLTYTTFAYSDLKVSPTKLAKAGNVQVSAIVKNTGKKPGEEVAQLYIQDVAASRTRPVKELKGFQRIALAPGETRTVSFTLTPELMGFLDERGSFILEPGVFNVWIGPSAAEGPTGSFELETV